MKKIKTLLIIALCSMSFVACNSVDRKIDQLERACKNHDTEKVLKLSEELEEQELTPDQEKRIAAISLDYMKSY